jgi:hypothetical protein
MLIPIVVVVVVFTVLNELDGLCRSRLAVESRAALDFLRERNPQIRYVTSKGAPLPNFAACTMSEENDDQVSPSTPWAFFQPGMDRCVMTSSVILALASPICSSLKISK